jgi:hypothetical protein
MSELIAENEGKSATDGSGVAADVVHLSQDLTGDASGWETSVDSVLCGLDILFNCANPLGGLISAGVGWLIEHIPGISDVWDKLMGDAAGIEQIANTWDNIARSVNSSKLSYDTASTQIESWSGPAAESYRSCAQAYSAALAGASTEAEALAVVVRLIGGIAAGCKDTIYTLISEFIEFTVLPAILAALATSWCTFGGSIAAAITYIEIQADITAGQITVQITRTTEEIVVLSERAARIVTKLEDLGRSLAALHQAVEEGGGLAKELLKGITHGEVESSKGL